MINSVYLILFALVLLFTLSVTYEFNVLSFIFSIIIVFYSEYNLQILTHCAGCFNILYSKLQGYFKNNSSSRNREGVYCSTPEMQNRYTSGIFTNEKLLSPISKNDQSDNSNGNLLNKSREIRTLLCPNRLSRYSLSEDSGYSNLNSSKLNISSTSPQLRSRASGVKTTQNVAGPLLASTRHRIDSCLLTDVNSPGLTRRIVQYNENSQCEKPTIEQRYKGIGQLPIINLNKNQLRKLPLNKSAVKIRIAPPDTSLYMTESRLHMLSTDQHRPLVPSPIQESTTPTKSVLEALKEISRKRIHAQDETEYSYSEDISKKQRKDSISKTNINSVPFVRPPISKRPRDEESHEFIDCSMFSKQSPSENSYKSWRPKKKQRNETIKCNDILSSLSSSRHLQRENYKRKAEMSPKDNAKQLKLTVHNVSNISIGGEDFQDSSIETATSENINQKKTEVLITNNPESVIKHKESPRILMFNKMVDKEINNSADSSDDENDADRIAFVKPRKEMYSENCASSLNYTEKCKLSQMLNCLSEKNNLDDNIPKEKVPLFSSESNKKLPEISMLPDQSKLVTSSANSNISVSENSNISVSKADNLIRLGTKEISNDKSTTNNLPPISVDSISNKSVITNSPTSSATISVFSNSLKSPVNSIDSTSTSQRLSNISQTNSSSPVSSKNNSIGGFCFPNNATSVESSIKLSETTQASLTSATFSFGKSNQTALPTSVCQKFTTSTLDKDNDKEKADIVVKSNESTSNITNQSNILNNIAFDTTNSQSLTSATETATIESNKSSFGNLNSTFIKPASTSMSSSTNTLGSDNKNLTTANSTTNLVSNNTTSMFNFGSNNKPILELDKTQNSASIVNGSSNVNTTTSALPMFNYNKTGINTTALNTANSTAENKLQTASGVSVFAFGTNSKVSTSASSAAAPQFNFGSQTKPAVVSSSTTPNVNAFGSVSNSSKQNTSIATSSVTSSFTFGSVSNTTTASIFGSIKPSLFSGVTNTTTSSSFNTPITSSVFGSNKTSSFGASSNPISFGITTTTTTPFAASVSNTLPVFGNTGTTFSTFGTTASTTVTTSAPIFSISNTSTSTFGTAKSSLSFGANTSSSTDTFKASSPFSLGSSAAVSNSNAYTFGNNVKTTETLGATPTFGANATTTFGVSTTTASFGTATTTSLFGNVSSTPIFGGSNTTSTFGNPATSAFGVTTTAPTFGTTTTAPAFGAATVNAPAFGASSATAFGTVNATSSFGAANPSAFGAASPPSLFGAVTTTAPFGGGTTALTFGGGNPNASFATPTTNTSIFGSSSQPAPQAPFGTTNTSDKNVFTFGSSNTSASTTPFQFGSQSTPGKSFNFNTTSIAPAFGSASQSVPTPSFNNSLSNPAGSFGAPSAGFGNPTGNMFSIGTGGSSKSRVRGRKPR